jgi:hypothetical protein
LKTVDGWAACFLEADLTGPLFNFLGACLAAFLGTGLAGALTVGLAPSLKAVAHIGLGSLKMQPSGLLGGSFDET